jgi:hypothetical protein
MKIIKKITTSLCALALSFAAVTAENLPVIQTKFTADPAPMVYNDTIFLYVTRDEAPADGGMANFQMFEWLLYTSTDMVNWTDHGAVASLKNFTWAGSNGAWAPQCIERNGKFYLYCPLHGKGIGVLVADSPYGPFIDPLGKPLVNNSTDDIDPTVFIDDDGQAYMYWGNPNLYYVKLDEDMISCSGKIVKDATKPDYYQEGPWVHKRNGKYYLSFASTCCPEGMGYAMSDRPFGAWESKGHIMQPNGKSSGNHPGIIDYKGKTYIFGFDYALHYANPKQTIHSERRSICTAVMNYNPDGTIREIPHWTSAEIEPVPQIENLNPYKRTEAETIAWSEGLATEKDETVGIYVTDIHNGDYIKVSGVNFGAAGAGMFEANVSNTNGGEIELRTGSITGAIIGTLHISHTGDRQEWKTERTNINGVTGVHDLYFVFKGVVDTGLFKFDYWKFTEKTATR